MFKSAICRNREAPLNVPAFAAGKSCCSGCSGARCDAVVLCSELADMSMEQFVRQLYQLKERPVLLVQCAGRRRAAVLPEGCDRCYCVEGTELKRLLWQLYRMPGQQNQQLEQQCGQLYETWGISRADINARYLTCAVSIVCSTSQKLAIRKEILQGVAEHHNVTVAAVDSGLRRLIDALETRQMPAWKAFKEKTHLAGQKVTAGKLIYTLRAQISQEYGY